MSVECNSTARFFQLLKPELIAISYTAGDSRKSWLERDLGMPVGPPFSYRANSVWKRVLSILHAYVREIFRNDGSQIESKHCTSIFCVDKSRLQLIPVGSIAQQVKSDGPRARGQSALSISGAGVRRVDSAIHRI